MAINEPFDNHDFSNPFRGLLHAAATLIPVGIAGHVAFKNIKSNSPVGQPGGGNLPNVGKGLGKNLPDLSKGRIGRLNAAQSLIDEFLQPDHITKLFQNVEEQRAVVQSLISAMDDPNSGFSDDIIISYKEKLVTLAQDAIDVNDLDGAKEAITSVVEALDSSGSPEAKAIWAGHLREFRGVAPQLQTPVGIVKSGERYQTVSSTHSSLQSGSGKRRYDQLMKMMGTAGNNGFDLIEDNKTGDVYANVKSGTGKHIATQPLFLADTGRPYARLRQGENLQTAYIADKYYMDAQVADDFRRQGKSFDQFKASPKIMELPDVMLNELGRNLKVSGNSVHMSREDTKAFKSYNSEFMTVEPRIMSGKKFNAFQGMSNHVESAASFGHNSLNLLNLERLKTGDADALVSGLSTNEGFEYVGSPGKISRRTGRRRVGKVGVKSNSAINALQTSTGANRDMFPVISNLEQNVGREAMFIGTGGRTMGRGGVMAAGATFSTSPSGKVIRTGSNIEWDDSVTGTTNKFVIMDLNNEVAKNLKGQGVGYHSGTNTLRTISTKPVLDPRAHGNFGSGLLNDIINQEPGEMLSLSKEELLKTQGYLGIGPSGTQSITVDPRTSRIQLGAQSGKAGGKDLIDVLQILDREMETGKAFGPLAKVTMQKTEQHRILAMAKEAGLDDRMLSDLGINPDDILITSGDPLKKAQGLQQLQLESAYGLVANDKDYKAKLKTKAAEGKIYGKLDSKNPLHITASAIMEGLVGKKISAQEAGLVLGGFHFYEDSEVVEEAIGKAWKEDPKMAAAVIEQARRGYTFGATSISPGSGVGDHGVARGGIEPRFMQNLQHRLTRMGLGEADVSEFLASIYQRKSGWQSGILASQGLTRMAESVMGSSPINASEDFLAGIKTYGFDDIDSMLVSKDSVADFIKDHKDGFLFDITKGADTEATRAIKSAALDKHGPGPIFIPGTNVQNAMKETSIKIADGVNVSVQDKFTQLVGGFIRKVGQMSTSTKSAQEESGQVMGRFKEDVLDLFTKTHHAVGGGKIKGYTGAVGAVYTLNTQGAFSSPERFEFARAMDKRTRGKAQWDSSLAFLNRVSDFMGSGGASSSDVRQAERFFLSSEGMDSKNLEGIASVTARNPTLSVGSVAETQVLRHVEEVGRGAADETWQAFTNHPSGQAALKTLNKKVGTKVQGFTELARHKGKEETREFLKTMIENSRSFMGTGGGQSYFVAQKLDVHYDGGKYSIDFGTAAAMGGDQDGDDYYTYHTGKKSKMLQDAMESGVGREWDNIYKVKSGIFEAEAKKGLKSHTAVAANAVADDILKQQASKQLVGKLDVSFNSLRTGLLDMGIKNDAGRAAVEEALAFLKIVQEHAVIKGKKLDTFRPFAAGLTKAVDILTTDGNIDPLDAFLRKEIFAGSALLEEGIQISTEGIDQMPEYLHPSIRSMSESGPVTLRGVLDTLQTSANTAIRSGIATGHVSSGQMNMLLGGNDNLAAREAMNRLHGGDTLPSAIVKATEGNTVKNVAASASNVVTKIQAAARSMDGKTMGIAAMGIAASMAAVGLVSGGGYASEPLSMPGEVVSPQVRDSLASGDAFRGKQVGPTPESMQRNQDRYAMMNRPINSGATYMNRPNHYQIRGQVPSSRGINGIQSFMNGLPGVGGGGSVMINDARRPITPNYMDRMLGE
jgi:hypothetical protein